MIKSIIFDLGNVLVDVHYEQFRDKLCRNDITTATYDNFFLDGNYRKLGYESGMITTDEFVSKCITGLNLKMSSVEFMNSFNDMFSEITPMKDLVIRLSEEKKYNLFLLSNTSPLHFDYVKEKFDYVNRLHKYGLSYKLKSLKPDNEIYHKAIRLFCAEPEECLFIDDLAENCEAAGKLGIRTITYNKNNHASFENEFQKIMSFN